MVVQPERRGNVGGMLWRTADQYPHKPAVVERERTATYAQLRSRAAAIATSLRQTGVEPGDRVVILLERGIDAVAGYFGVLAAGGIAVVLNDVLRPRQVEYALNHSGARALLTSSAVRSRSHRPFETAAAVLAVETIESSGRFEPAPKVSSSRAQITYTSGCPGLPKGA